MTFTNLWIAWILIGIVGGYMAARLLLPGRNSIVTIVSGIVGSIIGGYGLVFFLGWADPYSYASLLTSMIICAIAVWICVAAQDRRKRS